MHKHKLSHAEEVKGGEHSHSHHKKMHDHHMKMAKHHATHLHKMAKGSHHHGHHHVTAHDRAVDRKNISHARAVKAKHARGK